MSPRLHQDATHVSSTSVICIEKCTHIHEFIFSANLKTGATPLSTNLVTGDKMTQSQFVVLNNWFRMQLHQRLGLGKYLIWFELDRTKGSERENERRVSFQVSFHFCSIIEPHVSYQRKMEGKCEKDYSYRMTRSSQIRAPFNFLVSFLKKKNPQYQSKKVWHLTSTNSFKLINKRIFFN